MLPSFLSPVEKRLSFLGVDLNFKESTGVVKVEGYWRVSRFNLNFWVSIVGVKGLLASKYLSSDCGFDFGLSSNLKISAFLISYLGMTGFLGGLEDAL